MRHVRIRPGVPLDGSALEILIVAAYRDIVAKLKADRAA
jgi:DNA-binding protein YbaB